MTAGVRGPGVGPADGWLGDAGGDLLDAAGDGGLDGLALAALAELDAPDAAAPAVAATQARTLEAILGGAGGEAAARASLELGRAAAALARVVRRGARPGESEREQKMREVIARYLELMQEAAAGVARISVG